MGKWIRIDLVEKKEVKYDEKPNQGSDVATKLIMVSLGGGDDGVKV